MIVLSDGDLYWKKLQGFSFYDEKIDNYLKEKWFVNKQFPSPMMRIRNLIRFTDMRMIRSN